MEFLHSILVAPFVEIADSPSFFFEVVIGGLMAGVMYSLVALGFVLIFKASGVFNFAQGIMVLFAALFFVGFIDQGVPIWLSFLLTMAVMIGLAFAIERVVLRHLVNQEPIILFMATIGIAFFLEGLGETIWGADVRRLDVGIPEDAWFVGSSIFGEGNEMLIQQNDLFAAVTAGSLVVVLALFFTYTRTGRALRAVADDHQAALSIGIPLKDIWVIVWAVAGFVALVAGIMWGSKLGVQFSLSIIALKALPVLILGGFTSVPGAIIGGLIIGAGEKVAEVYWGSQFGGAIEEWFAYVLALIFLFFRPQGLFGEKIIERV
ncbi:MAG: branched-chain amino acid ABC transporter permease [Alphaproteobacteria bacterium]|nr:branched-chain amino acid ABC transporter permease [Alphaproteobacteria bacterium]